MYFLEQPDSWQNQVQQLFVCRHTQHSDWSRQLCADKTPRFWKMNDTAGTDIGREVGISRPPSLSWINGQPVDQESPCSAQSPGTPCNGSKLDRQSNSFKKKEKKKMNIDNLLEAMDNAHAALVHVVATTTEEHLLHKVSSPGSPGAEERNAMIRSAADGLGWWVTRMRETNAKVPFVPSSPLRQNSTPRSTAGLEDFVERCEKTRGKSDRRTSDVRRASSSLIPDSKASRAPSSGTTPTMPEGSEDIKEPQRQTVDPRSLEEQVRALTKERDELKKAHEEEIKQREHYKTLSSTLVDKMASVLEALKKVRPGPPAFALSVHVHLTLEHEQQKMDFVAPTNALVAF